MKTKLLKRIRNRYTYIFLPDDTIRVFDNKSRTTFIKDCPADFLVSLPKSISGQGQFSNLSYESRLISRIYLIEYKEERMKALLPV